MHVLQQLVASRTLKYGNYRKNMLDESDAADVRAMDEGWQKLRVISHDLTRLRTFTIMVGE